MGTAYLLHDAASSQADIWDPGPTSLVILEHLQNLKVSPLSREQDSFKNAQVESPKCASFSPYTTTPGALSPKCSNLVPLQGASLRSTSHC